MTACNICSLEHCQASFFNGDDIVKDFKQLQRVVDQVQECVHSVFCEKLKITYCGISPDQKYFGLLFIADGGHSNENDALALIAKFEYKERKSFDIASEVVRKIKDSSYPIDNKPPRLSLTHTLAEKALHEKIFKELTNNRWCGTELPKPIL